MKLSNIPLRAIPGAFIVNSGLGKLGMDAESSKGLQDFAATGIKELKQLPSDKFGQIIGASEIAVGGALLAPFVSNRIAGAGLTAFGAGLLTLYFGDDDNTLDDGIRPSEQGLSLAKDSWLLAAGLTLLLQKK
ncbi:Hypothetical protein NG00_01659 [Corynebacterium camporealensis]|uniref:Uncharacterized protein n=1 Tax=Corynebacterium camporealensis TaxID=161896 RepID=A0A0F6QX39_9CORY|nr:hypothetical protein [Corynebacterium camporealensis]AKE39777.1 hypothetical protein UL81_09160 [Corynebacterium camporealensis]AVH88899.1 Hypothetical protein NG00_01659 [Corynebacterium camporealensis]